MRAVNLLPQEVRPGHRWARIGRSTPARRTLGASGIAAGVIAIALAGLVVHERGIVADRQAELTQVEARLVAAEAKAAEVRAAQAAAAARLAAARDVISRRVAWEDVMRDFSRVLPPNAYLQSMQVSAAGGATTGTVAPTGFTISGFADSQNRVAQVLDRLALLPWLTSVTLTSSARSGGSDGGTAVQFTIGATFSSTGGR